MAVLKEEDKDFVWRKPEKCPSCQSHRVWGHGYVLRYFDDYPEGLYLKRFRCPECGAVHTARPTGYFPRFQAHINDIYRSLLRKLESHRWIASFSRQRQQYWFRGLIRQSNAQKLGNELSPFLTECYKDSFCFPSHSLNHKVIFPHPYSAYPSLAVTDHKIPP